MHSNKTRLTALSGATLALVLAATASVVAAGPRNDDLGFGHGGRGIDRGMDGWGQWGMGQRGSMWGGSSGFERREVTLQTADNVSVQRVENGVVDAVGDASLDFSLGSGEAVSVTVDDSTQVIAYEATTVERGGWTRQRMVPSKITLTDIPTGATVMVWSDSDDGSAFVAQRIVVQPVTDVGVTTDDSGAATDASDATTTPEASPAADA